ncbi:unnamed protein product [Vicia faba]|uniref:Uncharacterized protein n=1 Tax=Vicia faba TaxID=3906 RepID=A0AAV0YLI6_VICFA|nr:unnamed protein product [Vicia faba]
MKDDDYYDFAAYACGTQLDGEMFVEHDVTDIGASVSSPRCVNENVKMEGCDDNLVEGLGDSEDERSTVIIDGFEGICVTKPINESPSVGEFMTGSKQ